MIRRSLKIAATGVVAATLALTGCSTGSTDAEDAPEAATSVDADAFPVTVEHALGETTIEEEPTRIATLGFADQDIALSLGVVPVGAPEMTFGGTDEGSTVWFDEKLDEVGGEAPERYNAETSIPVQEIGALEPDVILATSSGLTQAQYDKLSKIAPVIAYPGAPWVTTWQDGLEMVGQALGRSDLAADVAEETQGAIDASVQEYPELADTTFLSTGLYHSTGFAQIPVYGAEDVRPQLLTQLGMKNAPVVEEVVPEGEFYANVSAERSKELDSDFLLNFGDDEASFEAIQDDELVGEIPAVKSGHWVNVTDQTVGMAISAPSPLAIPYTLDHLVPDIATAVGGEAVSD